MYLPSGEGDHLFLWIEKKNISALELLRRVARILKVSRNDIGMAGMKDRHAVTRQWISIPASRNLDFDTDLTGPLDNKITILKQKRHQNKLKTGHLKGNKFTIRMRKIEGTNFHELSELVERLNTKGIPNYYGTQRFGIENQTLEMGKRFILREEYIREKRLRRLALSAVQSAVFNITLAERIEGGAFDKALSGDIFAQVLDEGDKRCLAKNLQKDTQRIRNNKCVPTGPMPGVKMTRAIEDVGEMEARALKSVGLEWDDFNGLEKIIRGTRRPLICRPLSSIKVEKIENDIQFIFSLPAGSYATVALAQVLEF